MSLIERTEAVSTQQLRPYYRNARQGDVDAIAASLERTGQYRAVVVNIGTATGRPYEVLAGNHTLAAALRLGWSELDASLVDVDEDTATRIVLADNRTADLGGYDESALAGLLQDADGLEGTGYTEGDLDKLLSGLNGAPGSADFLQPGEDAYTEQYGVIAVCTSEEEQERVFDQLRDLGLNVRVVTV